MAKLCSLLEKSLVGWTPALAEFHGNWMNPKVNFTYILLAAFQPISFSQKTTNPNCKHIKSAKNICVQ
jgi:hypothetical protein